MQNYISATYPDGSTKILFTPLAPYETPEALERICEEYNRVIGNLELEPLIAIPVFIHDFLCIHPFNDGNGRMSRLLTALLLYRSGYVVGKYISIENKIAKKMGFEKCFPVSGQTYSRKMDTRVLNVVAGIAASAHKILKRYSFVTAFERN